MINFEGGAIPAEYHTAYIVDRVNTTATVWLGLTLAYAQCHDHKYDPFTQKEYYQLYAFFNNVPERGLDGSKGNAVPLLKVPTSHQERELARLSTAIRRAESGRTGMGLLGGGAGLNRAQARLDGLVKAQTDLDKQIPDMMVMQEMEKPRDTFLLMRGQYDKKGDKVTPGTPAALPRLLPENVPQRAANRMDLARWLVRADNPLTARVIVHRDWQRYFGTGLVTTAEDLGTQGEFPTHPELLDWLATEFVRTGWDVKHMQKLIVMSATYRQSSVVNRSLLAKDPENRLLARQTRLRLPAE